MYKFFNVFRSEKSLVAQRRIGYIIDYLTYEIFKYICRGLYESHKYMFTLLLTMKVDLQRRAINHEEFQNFIKGINLVMLIILFKLN